MSISHTISIIFSFIGALYFFSVCLSPSKRRASGSYENIAYDQSGSVQFVGNPPKLPPKLNRNKGYLPTKATQGSHTDTNSSMISEVRQLTAEISSLTGGHNSSNNKTSPSIPRQRRETSGVSGSVGEVNRLPTSSSNGKHIHQSHQNRKNHQSYRPSTYTSSSHDPSPYTSSPYTSSLLNPPAAQRPVQRVIRHNGMGCRAASQIGGYVTSPPLKVGL